MEGADWFGDPGPDSVASVFGYWVPALIAGLSWLSYRRVRNARRAYWSLPPSERELVVKALLFVVHNGAIEKGQSAPGYVRKPALVLADLLDLNRHTVDEGLRRLIQHGYLGGNRGTSVWTLTTHVELTTKGRAFYDRHFGRTGGVYDLAPWGTVILSAPAPEPSSVRNLVALSQEKDGTTRPATPQDRP
jgi:hypothetical protein